MTKKEQVQLSQCPWKKTPMLRQSKLLVVPTRHYAKDARYGRREQPSGLATLFVVRNFFPR
jgi:hypothetical protein